MKAVVIASGGMDSATLAYHYASKGYEVTLVGFNYGQRHKKELNYLPAIAEAVNGNYRIVDLSALTSHIGTSSLTNPDIEVPDGHYAEETMRITVVPNRNAIMLSVAAGIAVAHGAQIVATGIHSGDHYIYPDCRPDFFNAIKEAIIQGNEGHTVEGFNVEAPFIYMFKSDIAAHGAELNVDYSNTWSCYKGGDIHCGACGTCFERREAFAVAGLNDPTEYASTPQYENPIKETDASSN